LLSASDDKTGASVKTTMTKSTRHPKTCLADLRNLVFAFKRKATLRLIKYTACALKEFCFQKAINTEPDLR